MVTYIFTRLILLVGIQYSVVPSGLINVDNFNTLINMYLGLLLTIFYLKLILAEFSPVIDLLKLKNINSIYFLHCFELKYEVLALKQFQKYGIGSTSYNIKRKTYGVPFGYSQVGLFLNTSCKSWERIFASDVLKYKNQFSWVIFTENFSDTVNILTKYPIEINSDVTIIVKRGKKYLLYEIYNTGFDSRGKFVIRNIGFWDKQLYVKDQLDRNNFQGLVLKCGVVLMEDVEDKMAEHYLTVTSRDKVDPLHRFKYFKMLSHLQDFLNFSCNIVRTNSWGYQHNASFDGLVGVLQRREADIGGVPVFYRSERADVVDYTAQIWPSKPYIILRQPKYPGSFYTVYTRPLTKKAWFCIFAVLTLSGCILGVLLKNKLLNCAHDQEDTSASLALLFVFGAVSQQGMPVNKKSTSVMIVVFVTFIFTLTLYQYYNATVVSTLLRVPPKVIDSVKDLIKSDMKAGVDDALYNRDFFKHTTDPLAIKLYNKKIVQGSHTNYLTPEQGMALVKKGGFAFLVDTATAYRVMRKTFLEPEVCDATQVSLYPPQSMGSIAKKGSPYREFLAVGTAKMLESGVMYRLKTMWDEPRPPCVRTPDASVFSVSIYEFSMALVLLLGGIVASIVVLLFEIIVQRVMVKVSKLRRKMELRNVIEFRH